MQAALVNTGFVHDVPLGHRGALRVVVSDQFPLNIRTNTLLIASTRYNHSFAISKPRNLDPPGNLREEPTTI
jgi:hypothetical protein